ncbi:MAG: PGPGW domain-containing protein [Nitrospiraceae bacterium]|nr:MAG: PGPGW domain-containing protein [Nitrospiraceae bacterium]
MKKKDTFTIKTVKQAKRVIKVVIGFTVLVLGLIMLVTPGPGVVTIILGLAILGTEFVWAKKLMKRFEKEAVNVKNSFVNNYINKAK